MTTLDVEALDPIRLDIEIDRLRKLHAETSKKWAKNTEDAAVAKHEWKIARAKVIHGNEGMPEYRCDAKAIVDNEALYTKYEVAEAARDGAEIITESIAENIRALQSLRRTGPGSWT